MPIPYRHPPKTSSHQCAAFLEVVWVQEKHTFYGALLLIDAKGQPLEFIHNTLTAPSGFLWPADQVRSIGIAELCHSLFKACSLEPLILLSTSNIGTPEYCKSVIAPAIPFAQIVRADVHKIFSINWINGQPTSGSTAYMLMEDLRSNGFISEPFNRLHNGLAEMYPEVIWPED